MFKNISQLKKSIKVGLSVFVQNELHKTSEERIVVATQTNGFYTGKLLNEDELKTHISRYNNSSVVYLDGKPYSKIFIQYPKSSESLIVNDTLNFLAVKKKLSYGSVVISPSSDFTEGQVWLKMIFK